MSESVLPYLSDLMLKQQKIKMHLESKKVTKKISRQSKIKCGWCNSVVEDSYYFCDYHRFIFCANCAKNYGQQAIKRTDAPKCDNFKRDCILNKIEVKDEQKNEI